LIEKSPYHNQTANEIDWIKRVELQGEIQKYVTHSISSTINLPSDVSVEKVGEIYLESWRQGLKGITVYQWNVEVCSLHLGDIKTKIAENRVKTQVSEPYKNVFDKVYSLMNAHVDEGTEPLEVALYIEKLLEKKSWKAHYYFGKFGQKIGVPLKWILPQKTYENLMKKYNKLD
jgi:hypothetical protein